MKEIESLCIERCHQTQNMVQWWGFVKAAMNIHFPKRQGISWLYSRLPACGKAPLSMELAINIKLSDVWTPDYHMRRRSWWHTEVTQRKYFRNPLGDHYMTPVTNRNRSNEEEWRTQWCIISYAQTWYSPTGSVSSPSFKQSYWLLPRKWSHACLLFTHLRLC